MRGRDGRARRGFGRLADLQMDHMAARRLDPGGGRHHVHHHERRNLAAGRGNQQLADAVADGVVEHHFLLGRGAEVVS